jgi:hypothetical protein
VTTSQANPFNGWRDRFRSADQLGATAPVKARRRRGQDFEQILEDMLAEAGLEPRIRFRPDGEEIDGSFFHRGRVLLLEAKWTREPQPASSIYQFRGKVEGKLVGTIGVFISMSGFSKDAVDALVAGKVLNVVLFDGDDMRAVASGQFGFSDALDRKLRVAAEVGTPFSPLRDPISGQPLYLRQGPDAERPTRVVVVEGQADALLVHVVAAALGPSAYTLEAVPAGGVSNLAALAGAAAAAGFAAPVLVVADGDRLPAAVQRRIESDLANRGLDVSRQVKVIVLDPSLEEALGIAGLVPADGRDPGQELKHLGGRLQADRLRLLAAQDPQVGRLLRGLGLD